MPIHQIILKEPMYTESEVHELKDIIKTQENYINKTLRNDSDKVSKEIKKLRKNLDDIMGDYWYILQCYANKNTHFPNEIKGYEDKYYRLQKALKESE